MQNVNTELHTFYERLQNDGAHFFVNDKPVDMKKAYKKAVGEECVYMADYILGETGKISEVRLNRIALL